MQPPPTLQSILNIYALLRFDASLVLALSITPLVIYARGMVGNLAFNVLEGILVLKPLASNQYTILTGSSRTGNQTRRDISNVCVPYRSRLGRAAVQEDA